MNICAQNCQIKIVQLTEFLFFFNKKNQYVIQPRCVIAKGIVCDSFIAKQSVKRWRQAGWTFVLYNPLLPFRIHNWKLVASKNVLESELYGLNLAI